MQSISRFFGLLTCICMMSMITHAGDRGQLVLVAPIMPPYYITTADGQDGGITHDRFAQLAQHAGLPWKRVTLPTRRAINYFLTGDNTIAIAVKNPAFSELDFVLVADEPIGEMVLNLYQPTSRPKLKDIASLQGGHLVLLRNYGYGGLRKWLDDPVNNIDQEVTGSAVEALRLVERDFVDAALLYDVNYKLAVQQLGYTPDNISIQNLQRVPLYLHVNRKTLPGARSVLERLMQSHQRLLDDGIIIPIGAKISG